MKFSIVDAPYIRLRSENTVPYSCFNLVRPYAKPTTKSAAGLEIMSQSRMADGIKLRTIAFNAHEPMNLNCNVSSLRVAVQYMLKGQLSISTSNQQTVLLDEDSYAVRVIDNAHDNFQLSPGISVFLSMEFSMRSLKDLVETNLSARHFADYLEANEKVVIGQGFGSKQLRQFFDYTINFEGYGALKDVIFKHRLSECFLRFLLDQESVKSGCIAESD